MDTMKNIIKTMTLLSILIITGLTDASPLTTKLFSFAKQTYGLVFKHPIVLQKGFQELCKSPGAYHHLLDTSGSTLKTISKTIILDDQFFHKNMALGNLKDLTAVIIHEHTHLDQDHAMKQMALQLQVKHALDNKQNIGIDGKPYSKELFEKKLLQLNRYHEYLADAGIKPYPDLCLNQYEHFNNVANDECKELIQVLNTSVDPAQRAYAKRILDVFQSKDVKALESLETNETHPIHARRALYFLDWANGKK